MSRLRLILKTTMMKESLFKEYVKEILFEAIGRRRARKKLRVFDFDDTLVKSQSLVHVTSSAGEKFDLTPGEYAVYETRPGDQFDYSDFSKLIDPKEIRWTVKILRSIVEKGGEVVILTARAHKGPVQEFLTSAGLPAIEVIALADSDPQRKADYIANRIEKDGFEYIEFFDDSHKNVAAVAGLQPRFPTVRIVPRHVVHRTGIS